MGQRARSRKDGKSKGIAIRRSGGSNPNNYITVCNVTVRGGGKSSSNKKKVKRKKKGK